MSLHPARPRPSMRAEAFDFPRRAPLLFLSAPTSSQLLCCHALSKPRFQPIASPIRPPCMLQMTWHPSWLARTRGLRGPLPCTDTIPNEPGPSQHPLHTSLLASSFIHEHPALSPAPCAGTSSRLQAERPWLTSCKAFPPQHVRTEALADGRLCDARLWDGGLEQAVRHTPSRRNLHALGTRLHARSGDAGRGRDRDRPAPAAPWCPPWV